ncbi:MAG: hypothetical protein AAGK32_13230 [Actinomycetota bacterium]
MSDEDQPSGPNAVWVAGAVGVVVLACVLSFWVFFPSDDDGEEATEPVEVDEPTLVVADDFQRADSEDSLGETEDGAAWVAVNGTWGIDDGAAVITAANADGPRTFAVMWMSSGDGSVEATAGSLGDGWGLVFRYQSPFNYWYVNASTENGTYRIFRLVNGSLESVSVASDLPMEDGTVVRVDHDGPTISLRVDDELALTFDDPALVEATGAGLVAFRAEPGSVSWDTFRAESVGTSPQAPPGVTVPTS